MIKINSKNVGCLSFGEWADSSFSRMAAINVVPLIDEQSMEVCGGICGESMQPIFGSRRGSAAINCLMPVAIPLYRYEVRRNFYSIDDVKQVAFGRWAEILNQVAGIGDDFLSGKHRPCPKCGGTDRFRFTNLNGNGSIICGQCAKGIGDGIDSVAWFLSIPKGEAIRRIGVYLGLGPRQNGITKPFSPVKCSPSQHSNSFDVLKKNQAEKAKAELKKIHNQISPFPGGWNQPLVAWWCHKRRSGKLITPESLRALGAFVAYYQPGKKRFTVLAVPLFGPGGVAGYFLYNLKERTLPGNRLPDGSYEQLKVKSLGSGLLRTELKINRKDQ